MADEIVHRHRAYHLNGVFRAGGKGQRSCRLIDGGDERGLIGGRKQEFGAQNLSILLGFAQDLGAGEQDQRAQQLRLCGTTAAVELVGQFAAKLGHGEMRLGAKPGQPVTVTQQCRVLGQGGIQRGYAGIVDTDTQFETALHAGKLLSDGGGFGQNHRLDLCQRVRHQTKAGGQNGAKGQHLFQHAGMGQQKPAFGQDFSVVIIEIDQGPWADATDLQGALQAGGIGQIVWQRQLGLFDQAIQVNYYGACGKFKVGIPLFKVVPTASAPQATGILMRPR